MNYLPKRDDFDEANDKTEPGLSPNNKPVDLSMYEALAFYEGNLNGFQVEDIKRLAGRFWNQEMWNSLAKQSFDLKNEGQSPRLPFYRKDLKAWFYFP